MKLDFHLSSGQKNSDKSVNLKIDLHCHTHYSIDSIIKPRELAAKAKKASIVPAISDHNTLAAHKELHALGMRFIPSEEIRTIEGDLIGLYLQEVIPKKTPFLEALDMIKEQGALSYLPHMFDKTRHGVAYHQLANKVDIIEAFNARCPLQKYNDDAIHFAKKHKKLIAAGSDSHFLFEFGRTYFEVSAEFEDIKDNPKALLRALKSVKIHAKKAPLFVRGSTLVVKFAKRFFAGLFPR